MSGGFGSGFGSTPFGSAALTITTLTIVQLTANQLAAPSYVGQDLADALNPARWSITPLDVGAHERLVQAVQVVTDENEQGFNIPQLVLVDLPITLLSLDGVLTYGKRYRVTFAGQVFDFTAMKVAASAAPADVRIDDGFIWDIANPYLSRDALVFPPRLGTYQNTDAGDIGVDKSGEAGLRKRITRRVLSASNSYFHLRGYGAGIDLKRTITVDMLRRLSARIRAQVLQEPEVAEVKCSLLQDPADPGVIRCTIDALTGAGGIQVVVTVRLP